MVIEDRSGGELRAIAREVACGPVAADATRVDAEAAWPREGLRALADADLLGLTVGVEHGGRGEGMSGLAVVTEELGRVCGSTALVFGMHAVASKVVAIRPTSHHLERYLAPIAAGEHVTSLALAEPGSGVHFWLPRTTFAPDGDRFVLEGSKSFVTSGGEADSYVASVVRAGADLDPGTFSCVLVDADAPDLVWGGPWDGFGMRGNSSRSVEFGGTTVPVANLLGEEGDETWYLFEVIAPYFIVAMAGTYLGVAQSALDACACHLRSRTYDHSGRPLGATDTIAHQLGDLYVRVERARQLLTHAAAAGDAGAPRAREALFACKAEVADTAVSVANDAMTLAGGIAYGADGPIARALRDARASHVMSPSTGLLKTWLGRSLLELPLL